MAKIKVTFEIELDLETATYLKSHAEGLSLPTYLSQVGQCSLQQAIEDALSLETKEINDGTVH